MNIRKIPVILLVLFLCSQNIIAGFYFDTNVKTKIISEVKTIKSGQSFWLAVKFEMQNDWHIYWRNSGDSGLPTSIDWTVPEGFLIYETYYPYPNILVENNSATFIYENEVLLFARVTPPSIINMNEVIISANANWLECKQACIPGSSEMTITLNVVDIKSEIDQPNLPINNWLNKLPIESSDWNFEVELIDETVKINGIKPKWFTSDDYEVNYFPYADDIFNHSKVQNIIINDQGFSLILGLNKFRSEDPILLNGILVISDRWLENESRQCLEISESIIITKEK